MLVLLQGRWTQLPLHLREHSPLLPQWQAFHDHGEADAVRIQQLLVRGGGGVDQRLRQVVADVLLIVVGIVEVVEDLVVLQDVDNSLGCHVLVLLG